MINYMRTSDIHLLIKSLHILDHGWSHNMESLPINKSQLSALKYIILRYLDIEGIYNQKRFVETFAGVRLEITFHIDDVNYKFYINPSNYFAHYVTPATYMFSHPQVVMFPKQYEIEELQHAYDDLCSILKCNTDIISQSKKDYLLTAIKAIYPELEIKNFAKNQYLIQLKDIKYSIISYKNEFKRNWKQLIQNYKETVQNQTYTNRPLL